MHEAHTQNTCSLNGEIQQEFLMTDTTRVTGALYHDASQPVDARVRDLLAHMTVDEKLAQLGSVWAFEVMQEGLAFSETRARDRLKHGIGQITRVGGSTNLPPAQSAALANSIQAFVINHTRLGIPVMVHEECCAGYMAHGATIFPQTIGVASTWDAAITEAMGDVIRVQMRAVGGHQALAPVLDVTRDPRWGRIEETFGEDPYLVGRLGSAYIKGLQGESWAEGIIATGKHFIGYGMSEGGRNWAPVFLPERELREVFVRPFEAAIRVVGLGSIMNAYHEMDGVPVGGSVEILRGLLRDQIGFDGLIVSDYFAVDMLSSYHKVVDGKTEAAALALEAGIEVELPSTNCYGDPLKAGLESGLIDIAVVDAAVRRVLDHKFRLGLFEQPYVDVDTVIEVFETPDQRQLGHDLACKSMVLLKNEGDLLPLSKDTAKIAVIGPNADSVRNLMGDYSYPAHIETLMEGTAFDTAKADNIQSVDRPVEMISILDAVRHLLPAADVQYAKGCEVLGDDDSGVAEAVALAEQADVAILVLGGKSGLTDDCTCGEARDRANLNLPGVQEELLRAVVATGTPVVLVLINGRPLTITWAAEHVPAILEAWLPGEEGASAVADILFGDYNPGGKLPVTFPRDVGQIPLFYNHKPSGNRSHWKEHYVDTSVHPLYPFGFGLSYTTFEIGNLQIAQDAVQVGDTVTIRVDVANTGDRAGDEVVQLYVRDAVSSVTRPVLELKGFQRITLKPGERKTVIFDLPVSLLAFYDRAMRYVVEPGRMEVLVGNSSANIVCKGSFEITGDVAEITDPAYFSAATVE
jgi:beta-glucosidase